MTREQLELLMEYIDEAIASAKLELQGDDPYWSPYWRDKNTNKVRTKLFKTLGETDE